MTDWDYSKTWYHGSPSELTTIRAESTITQDKDLARIFSHKPALVSIADDGDIKHNGTRPGFLYAISEPIQADDVAPHPRSTMEYGKEWLTKRPLSVVLIGPTRIEEAERLTEEEFDELKQRLKGPNNPCQRS